MFVGGRSGGGTFSRRDCMLGRGFRRPEPSDGTIFVSHSPKPTVPCGTEDTSTMGVSHYLLRSEDEEPPSVGSFRQILNFEIEAGPAQASRPRRLRRGRSFRPSRASRVFTRSEVHSEHDST